MGSLHLYDQGDIFLELHTLPDGTVRIIQLTNNNKYNGSNWVRFKNKAIMSLIDKHLNDFKIDNEF